MAGLVNEVVTLASGWARAIGPDGTGQLALSGFWACGTGPEIDWQAARTPPTTPTSTTNPINPGKYRIIASCSPANLIVFSRSRRRL